MNRETRPRVGITTLGKRMWLGGANYIINLVRSTASLPEAKRPLLSLVFEEGEAELAKTFDPILPLVDRVIVTGSAAPVDKGRFLAVRSMNELFDHVDFFYPVPSDVMPGRPAGSWIPDFQHKHLPEFFSREELANRDRTFARIADQAELLVLSSKSARADFRRFYPDSQARTRVLHFATSVDPEWLKADPPATAAKYRLPEEFFICCNHFWAHKDHATVFKALAGLKKRGARMHLACTGPTVDYRNPGYMEGMQALLAELGIADQVSILGVIPRDEQIALIRQSLAVLQPSLFEGWSTVVEDARCLGKHIFLSDLNVHKEQAPRHGFFFPTRDHARLTELLAENLDSLAPTPGSENEKSAFAEAAERKLRFGLAFSAMVREESENFARTAQSKKTARSATSGVNIHPATHAKEAVRSGLDLLPDFASFAKVSTHHTENIRLATSDFQRAAIIKEQEKLFDEALNASEFDDGTYVPRDYRVTAVVSTYKSEAFIGECLSDLVTQSLGKELEIIVVDADSPENERKIVRRFQREHDNIRYVRTPERIGVYSAWNLAIRLARGRAVTPFSTNDRLSPDAYRMMLEELDKRPETAMVYGDSYVTDEPHQEFGRHTPSKKRPENFVWPEFRVEELVSRAMVGPHPMWRAWVHGRVGYFDERYKAMADQEFWLRLGERFVVSHINEFTGLYWLAEDALSNHAKSDGPTQEKEHIRAIYRKRFEEARPPERKVSIIIPVFNQAEYTMRCLAALSRNTAYPRFEVIVVDNASSDETPRLLKGVSGNFKVIRNAENQGFTIACNQGAREADGDYLLFLNNDTEVLPGWLTALVDTLDREPSAGAVGARLIYPDGRLQEAGAVVLSDATAANFGRGDDPSRVAYNRFMETDYCSGACLLVRAELFDALGGFDLRYAPAYYEETDLAFAMRRLGYKTLYNPASAVIHHGSTTAGLDDTKGFRKYLPRNREKFRAKWQGELARQESPPKPGQEVLNSDRALLGRRVGAPVAPKQTPPRTVVLEASEARPAKSGSPNAAPKANLEGLGITILSDFLPRHDSTSSNYRVFQILRLLAGWNARLDYIHTVGGRGDEIYTEAFKGSVNFHLARPELGGLSRILAHTRPDVLWLTNLWTPEFLSLAGKLAAMAASLPGAPAVVYDTMDFHAKKYFRKYQTTRNLADVEKANLFLKLERALYPSADAVVAVSDAEKASIMENVPGAPKPVIVSNIQPMAEKLPAFDATRGLVFLGNFQVDHNVDAVAHFVREIYPLIRQKRPEIGFTVLGREAETAFAGLDAPGVTVRGFVPDLAEALSSFRLFVCPMLYGAGLKGKIGSAAAVGLPVVTNSLGAEGYDIRDGENGFVADDPEEFAAKCIRLHEEPDCWARMSAGIYDMLAGSCSRSAVGRELLGLLTALAARAGQERRNVG